MGSEDEHKKSSGIRAAEQEERSHAEYGEPRRKRQRINIRCPKIALPITREEEEDELEEGEIREELAEDEEEEAEQEGKGGESASSSAPRSKGVVTSDQRKNKKKFDDGNGKFQCSECPKYFLSLKAVAGHMRMHPGRAWRGLIRPEALEAEIPNRNSLPRESENVSDSTETLPSCSKRDSVFWEGMDDETKAKVEGAIEGFLLLVHGRCLPSSLEEDCGSQEADSDEESVEDVTDCDTALEKDTESSEEDPHDRDKNTGYEENKGNVVDSNDPAGDTEELRNGDSDKENKENVIDDNNTTPGDMDNSAEEPRNGCQGSDEPMQPSCPELNGEARGTNAGWGMGSARRKIYICGICQSGFTTYQALGGHVTSHRKENYFEGEWRQSLVESGATSSRQLQAEHGNAIACPKGLPAGHRCEICGQIFPTGQALGGHKRMHYVWPEDKPRKSNRKLLQQPPLVQVAHLDLNELPTAEY